MKKWILTLPIGTDSEKNPDVFFKADDRNPTCKKRFYENQLDVPCRCLKVQQNSYGTRLCATSLAVQQYAQ